LTVWGKALLCSLSSISNHHEHLLLAFELIKNFDLSSNWSQYDAEEYTSKEYKFGRVFEKIMSCFPQESKVALITNLL
jgi:hypothetical protein